MKPAQRYRRPPIGKWKLATCGAIPLYREDSSVQTFYVVAGWSGFRRRLPADGTITPNNVWPTNIVTGWQYRRWSANSGLLLRPYAVTQAYSLWWGVY